MLSSMRGSVGNVFSKVLLGLLILSFSVWGIEDMIMRGGASGELASVDGKAISPQAFDMAYRNELEEAKARLGKNYSPELMKLLGLERKVLQDIITRELLLREAASLGLMPSDKDMARQLMKSPDFQKDGKFDPERYQSYLRQTRQNEKSHLDALRRDTAVDLMLRALTYSAPLNPDMVKVVTEAQREERAIDLVTLTPAMIKLDEKADEETLKKFYESNKRQFMTPEYRSVSVLTVDTDALLKNVKVSEEDVKAAYEERAAMFGKDAAPFASVRADLERDLKRGKLEEAVAEVSPQVQDMLAGGATMEETAKKMGWKLTSYGPFDASGQTPEGAKAKLPEYDNFLETAFKVEEGTESTLMPVDNGKVYILLRTERVTPEGAQPFEKVRAKVAEDWLKQEKATRLRKLATDTAKAMQDAKSPAAAGTERKLKLADAGRVRRGDQKTTTNLSLPASLITNVFSIDRGQATDAHLGQDGNYMIAVVRSLHHGQKLSPNPSAKDGEASLIEQQLSASARNELLDSFLAHLRSKYHVKVNDAALAAHVNRDN